MNSHDTLGDQTLARVAPEEARSFLKELANLRNDNLAVVRFEKSFPEFLNRHDSQTHIVESVEAQDGIATSSGAQTFDYRYHSLFELRNQLREVWRTDEPDVREWRAAQFVAEPTMTVRFAAASGPPAPTPFQQAAVHLFRVAATMRYCQNPECPAPYFFAKRKSQMFCSDICTRPSQRAHKLRWWNETGKARRKSRAGKPKRRNAEKR